VYGRVQLEASEIFDHLFSGFYLKTTDFNGGTEIILFLKVLSRSSILQIHRHSDIYRPNDIHRPHDILLPNEGQRPQTLVRSQHFNDLLQHRFYENWFSP